MPSTPTRPTARRAARPVAAVALAGLLLLAAAGVALARHPARGRRGAATAAAPLAGRLVFSRPAKKPAPAPTTGSGTCKRLAGFGCSPAFGFNAYTNSQTIAEQQSEGAKVSRLFVDWTQVEPAAGQWEWQQTDSQYAAMVAGGLRPLIVVFTAPCWARPSTDCLNPYFTGPPDPAYDQDWKDFVGRVAARYPKAMGIEIWNEPNLDQYFLPHANPGRYTQLLTEAYAAVKAADPAMPVVSGGLLLSPSVAGAGNVPGGYAADQFLAAMYADGAQRAMDALGVHVYPSDYVDGVPSQWDPGAMHTWLSQLGAVRAAAGQTAQPIWITEMGVSTTTQLDWPAAATADQQATDLTSMINQAIADPSIQVVVLHTLQDEALNLADPTNLVQAGFGVFTAIGAPKPAACAVSRLWGGTLGC